MATTSNASQNNNNPSGHNNVCVDREQLLRYLQGWTDEATAQQLESHLSHCPDCDQSLSELESEVKIGWLEVAGPFGFSGFPQGTGEDDAGVDDGFSGGRSLPAVRSQAEPGNESVPGNERNQDNRSLESGLLNSELGNYQLLELIGRGGMAEVYKARHKRLQKEVALKLIRVPRWYLADSLGRIDREMQAVGRLNHPSIVRAMDAGEQNGIQYLATEYIDGLDLGRIARLIGKFPIAEACELIRTVALGLDYAHGEGIIHRDIKPSNLMLDRNGQVRILDFGLVHLDGWTGATAELTTVGQLLGTLDYMAPEQAERPDNVSHRSDVYSLGATLFRMLVGRAPYAASQQQSPLEKLRLLASERPPRVGTLAPELPQPLARLIDRCLDREPNLRPSSAAHLAEELTPFCDQADLQGLLKQAEQSSLAADSTKSSHASDSPSSFTASLSSLISHSLASESGLVQPETGPFPSAHPATATSGRGRKSNTRRRWLAWGMLPLCVFAGILLILETQKGQVIIESEVPNLQVELVADGKVYRELELVPGENSTRIYAGQYEVRISDGTDRYVVDQNKFVLKRGERVVARVTIEPEPGKASLAWSNRAAVDSTGEPSSGTGTAGTSVNTAEELAIGDGIAVESDQPRLVPGFPATPVYDGKSLGEWLWIIENELGEDGTATAVNALVALHDDQLLRPLIDDFVMNRIANGFLGSWVQRFVQDTSFPTPEQEEQVKLWCIQADGKAKQDLLSILLINHARKDFKKWLDCLVEIADLSTTSSWQNDKNNKNFVSEVSNYLAYALNPRIFFRNQVLTEPIRESQQKLLTTMIDQNIITAEKVLTDMFESSSYEIGVCIANSPWVIEELVSRVVKSPQILTDPDLKLAWLLIIAKESTDRLDIKQIVSLLLENSLHEPALLTRGGAVGSNLAPSEDGIMFSRFYGGLRFDRLKASVKQMHADDPRLAGYGLSLPIFDLIVLLDRCGELETEHLAMLNRVRAAISDDSLSFRNQLTAHFETSVLDDVTRSISIFFTHDSANVSVSVSEDQSRHVLRRRQWPAGVWGAGREVMEGLGGIADFRAREALDSPRCQVKADLAVAYLIDLKIQEILNSTNEVARAASATDSDD